jgi:hypothetical protein
MKRFLACISALGFLAIAVPAAAQDRHDEHDRGGHQEYRHEEYRHGPPPRHYYAPPPRRMYREGEIWNGHHLANRGGHWGYYQPRNGVQVFINIPL